MTSLTPPRIRLSQTAKNQLITLKRRTGIQQWNILCRWAFCLSLSVASKPNEADIKLDSNIEIDWETFAGEFNEDLYWALMKARCVRDEIALDQASINRQFILHIHRGISYLAFQKDIKSMKDLLLTSPGVDNVLRTDMV